MPAFNVQCDLLVPVLIEVEAGNADAAIDILMGMSRRELLALANTEESSIGIADGSEMAWEGAR